MARLLKPSDALRKAGILLGLILPISLAASCANRPSISDVAQSPSPEERAVVAVAAADLAHDEACNDGNGEAGVAVDAGAAPAIDLVSDDWLEAYLEPGMWAQMKPLMNTLRSIPADGRRIDWGFPESADIVSADFPAMSATARARLLARVRCFASFLRPAISGDGKSAVVWANLGSSPHGAAAFYVLTKSEGRWAVSMRKVLEWL